MTRTHGCARYDQYGNLVVDEERDYLGALVAVRRADTKGRDVPTTPEDLALLQIQEEEIFDQVGGPDVLCLVVLFVDVVIRRWLLPSCMLPCLHRQCSVA
jgi:hypothetical protein